MASNLLISCLFAIGASAWIYAKINRQSGGNSKNSLIVAGTSGALLFFLMLLVLNLIF